MTYFSDCHYFFFNLFSSSRVTLRVVLLGLLLLNTHNQYHVIPILSFYWLYFPLCHNIHVSDHLCGRVRPAAWTEAGGQCFTCSPVPHPLPSAGPNQNGRLILFDEDGDAATSDRIGQIWLLIIVCCVLMCINSRPIFCCCQCVLYTDLLRFCIQDRWEVPCKAIVNNQVVLWCVFVYLPLQKYIINGFSGNIRWAGFWLIGRF